MSVSIYVDRYGDGLSKGGRKKPITREDIEVAVKKLPSYSIVEEDGMVGVKIPGTHVVAVLEGAALSCQLDAQTDVDVLVEYLQKLAANIPGAIVQDEEGNTY